MRSVVYFIRDGEFVKIGYSDNPKRRMSDLQMANPRKLEFLGSFPGGEADEQRLHMVFEQFHIRNEWFFYSDAIRRFAEKHCFAYTEDDVGFQIDATSKQDGGEVFLKWLATNVFESDDSRIESDACYKHYCKWCDSNNSLPMRRTVFGHRMANYLVSVGGQNIRQNKTIYHSGIRLSVKVPSLPKIRRRKDALPIAEAWLRDFLKDGPRSASEARDAAEEADVCCHSTLKIAMRNICGVITKTSNGRNIPHMWSLDVPQSVKLAA